MIPTAAAGRSPVPEEQEEEEEVAALSVSDQRTLYLVNIFIGNTARFLNSFASLCQDKLAQVHRRISRLDANLSILEAQLRSTCPKQETENKVPLEGACSSSESRP
ncbi:WASH complex subunit CCDC53-like [Canna indica]|uniref:WASH complex subunit CCDC53-like n=1 Tax=Canna indica TaxID=4628 RepID=A0AAQ3JTC2_9LILI|nr:WASH complex subunit CCDC53-like [Canna indica]